MGIKSRVIMLSTVTVFLILLITANAQTKSRFPPKLPVCLSFEEPYGKCENVHKIYKRQRFVRDDRGINVDWSNVVILMIMHESASVDSLITGHFETWLKHTGEGLDIVFITDDTDKRSDEDIIPDASNFLGKTHIYRSPAQFDDKHIRFKVIDSFRQVEEMFKDDEEKKYFIKIDTDTFPIAENLLSYLNKLDGPTEEQPVLFGKGVCSPKDLCYAAGALYGMNKLALHALNNFFAKNPELHLETTHVVGKGRNLMVHEDYMTSYAYRRATGYPIISNHNIFNYHIEREGVGSEEHPPVCYHKAKVVEGLQEYYQLLYDEETNKLRKLSDVATLWETQRERFPYLAKSADGDGKGSSNTLNV